MDKPEGAETEGTQKVKLVFLSLAALVLLLLIWSLYAANKARAERDAARQEVETFKQDNARLEQLLKDQNQELDSTKKKLAQCEAKAKAKPAAKKKSTTKSKKSKTKKSQQP
ncbi:MAG TPA: hypothetical protein VK654_05605 [Nitrospirota bacterium]|nr:hypothetical protein [Nitrospirota bacterium]